MSREIFIHVGFPKAASTTLQVRVFAQYPDVDYIGHPTILDNDQHRRLVHTIHSRDEIEFEQGLGRFIEEVVQPLTGARGGKLIVSDEGFATGTADRGSPSRLGIVLRLKRLFPTARILMVVRAQQTIIPSWYLQRVRGERLSPARFETWLASNWDRLDLSSDFHLFKYFELAEVFTRHFGRDGVRILLFEQLAKEPAAFAEGLAEYMGLDASVCRARLIGRTENPRVTHSELLLRRWVAAFPVGRKLLPSALRREALRLSSKGRPLSVDLSAQWAARLREYYSPSNRRLMQDYGVPLDRYGYAI